MAAVVPGTPRGGVTAVGLTPSRTPYSTHASKGTTPAAHASSEKGGEQPTKLNLTPANSALRTRKPTSPAKRSDATPSPFGATRLSAGGKHDPAAELARRNLAALFDIDEADDYDSPASANTSWSSTDSQPVHEIVGELESDFTNTVSDAADKLLLLAIEANEGQRNELAASGAPAKLVQLVNSGAPTDEVIGALQNFAASENPDDDVKSELVRAGVVTTLLNLLREGTEKAPALKSAVAVLLNLAIGSETRKVIMRDAGVIEILAPLIDSEDAELQASAMRALTSLSIGSDMRKNEISHAIDIKKLVDTLSVATDEEIWHPALGLIQSLVFCNDDRKRTILDLNFIPKATMLLSSGKLTVDAEGMLTKLLVGFAAYQGMMSKQASSPCSPQRGQELSAVGGAVQLLAEGVSTMWTNLF